ncbi:calmodulin, putative [Entamoeba invadens IP1]|uniref:calmodulin, putative n=1 Tax=Entamoeba invadens IP1 TaxID=370355 RepID=UPI0002C3E534|nr:calmodulin, putative [Entamoeba invadens IP1]ELP90757.1 calmodulin, putative [Entamoeba invadens IP1]|eukprot:XP_004257528.1 calmodulin, putative [Entamoeba invadens IP1]
MELRNPMSCFTEEQKKRFLNAFKQFDKDKDNFITFQEMAGAIRSIGLNLDENEAAEMSKAHNVDKIDQSLFLQIAAQKLQDPDTEAEIQKAFETFFGVGKTTVPVDEFKKMMMDFGEKISADEADELIKDINPKDGMIDISAFVKGVFAQN